MILSLNINFKYMENPVEVAYPVNFNAEKPASNNRLLGLCGILIQLKQLLLIPHAFVLFFLGIWLIIVTWINFWVILFTGKGLASVQSYQIGVLRWMVRVQSWFLGLTDKYPPFSLDA